MSILQCRPETRSASGVVRPDDWRRLVGAVEHARRAVPASRRAAARVGCETGGRPGFPQSRVELARAMTQQGARSSVPDWVIRYARRVLNWSM